MTFLEAASPPALDPLQGVLAHLPAGAYGTYQGLCQQLATGQSVPSGVMEGLRFLSAVRNGCAYCQTVRLSDVAGQRLLPDDFYDAVRKHDRVEWDAVVEPPWAPVFTMAEDVLSEGVISERTQRQLLDQLAQQDIVLCLFYLEVVGASHRFSRAAGVPESCEMPVAEEQAPRVRPGQLRFTVDGAGRRP